MATFEEVIDYLKKQATDDEKIKLADILKEVDTGIDTEIKARRLKVLINVTEAGFANAKKTLLVAFELLNTDPKSVVIPLKEELVAQLRSYLDSDVDWEK